MVSLSLAPLFLYALGDQGDELTNRLWRMLRWLVEIYLPMVFHFCSQSE